MTVNLFSVLHHPAFAGVERSGRGCNPRPAREFALEDDGEVAAGIWVAKQSFAGTHSQAALGNDRVRGEAALRKTHSQAALGNDKGGGAWERQRGRQGTAGDGRGG